LGTISFGFRISIFVILASKKAKKLNFKIQIFILPLTKMVLNPFLGNLLLPKGYKGVVYRCICMGKVKKFEPFRTLIIRRNIALGKSCGLNQPPAILGLILML